MNSWKNKNLTQATYAHFDRRVKLNENKVIHDDVWSYIQNKDNIATHGFYPFIYHEKVVYKYSKANGVTSKTRPICYSGHLDRCIYKYYGHLLNEKYNEYAIKNNINDTAVAYRNNLKKNNIHYAKQAFDFIQQGECDIIIGDFTSFFSNLDHKYLKQMLCKVLDVTSLSPDWYAIYKNITRYSTWDLLSILKINGLLNDNELELINQPKSMLLTKKIKQLNKKEILLSKKQFRQYSKTCIKPNKSGVGIPQGSTISAVLSNVYLIEFDKKIHDYVTNLKGLYLRYSDDFIVIMPKNKDVSFKKCLGFINDCISDTKKLSIQEEKNKMYHYDGINTVTSIKSAKEGSTLDAVDYLGFVFDGKTITLRPKTITKYYYRMYRKLNFIIDCKGITKYGTSISYKNLYRVYTQKGRNGQYIKKYLPQKVLTKTKNKYENGNFFTYVYTADRIFKSGDNSDKVAITQSTKKHMLKIRRKRQLLDVK